METSCPCDLRDDLIVIPPRDAQDGILMCLPHCPRPHDGQIPDDDEAFCVSGDETVIVPDKGRRMDLGFVSSQHRLWL